ncbi:MAG TPA: hypothetical protein VKA27_14470, partial [Sunxiuqinia sp.]|nr:hypothetical protein [Sunxiuqinia sp.]
RQVPKLLENTNDPKNLVNDLNAAMPTKYTPFFAKGDLPVGLYVQYEKTVPKVYRQTWSAQPAMKRLLGEVPKEEIYTKLIKPNMLDVTSQYLKGANVSVWKSIFGNKNMAYLATFDRSGWIPVAFSRFSWYGRAIFKNIGKNILYLPMVCENKRMIPEGDPFVIKNNGEKKILKCNRNKKIDMVLIRKFPFFSYTAAHSVSLKGCKIEGANDRHFKDAKLLFQIDHYPFYMQQIDLAIPDSFRYAHLIAPNHEAIRVAEFDCYTDSCGIFKKLVDVGTQRSRFENAFDDDLNSYTVGRWVRHDFGSRQQIDRIKFCPRNDTNCIIPGYEYELFYWDKKWISAGKKIARDYRLKYENIPSGTIYWLKCLTKGKEERIFTYENGKQDWW